MSSKNAFGLDIGDTSLKLVWLNNRKYIKAYNEISLEPGLIEKSVIEEKGKVIAAIKKLISTARGDKIKTRRVIACLPEPKTFIKVIEAPVDIRKSETEEFVLDKIHHFFPLTTEEIYSDWQIFSERKGSLKKIIVGAAPKEISDSYFNLLSEAGLLVQELQIEAVAITNALISEMKDKKEQEHPKIILDLGANRSSLILFDQGAIQFSISIPVSGIEMTNEIASKMRLSFYEAEKKKISSGLRDAASPVYKIIEKNLRLVVKEINRAVKFYSREGGGVVREIILCGGVAGMKKLSEYFSSKTNFKVSFGNPFANIKPLERQKIKFSNPLSFTTAIGLALGGLRK